MSVYTQTAMDALRAARRNNPNVSQRGLARNIFMLTHLDRISDTLFTPMVESTNALFRLLGHPSEVALQHLIRGIDRQARQAQNEVTMTVGASRSPRNRNTRNRNRKTVGRGRRIKV